MKMTESYSEVQNFWHDLQKQFSTQIIFSPQTQICEPLCEIHTIKPCENNWGSFAKICCGLCDFQCDVECSGPVTTTTTTPVTTPVTTSGKTPILLYVLTSVFSVIGRVL